MQPEWGGNKFLQGAVQMASRYSVKSTTFASRRNFGAQGLIRTVALSMVIAVIALFSWAPEAGAYQAYSNNTDGTLCGACHGTFAGGTYISNKDGTNWGTNLHNGHRTTMLAGDCNTCHGGAGTSGREVFLKSSAGGDGLDPIACVGCHGRAEDVTAGGDYGAGLRQQHWVGGITECGDCHGDANPASFTPVAENVPPPYYFTPDTAHPAKPTDACDANGSESVFGPTGLDNDGNGQIDGADANCANIPPVAVDDAATTPFETAAIIDVLANDTDADSGPSPLAVDSVTQGTNGSVTNNGGDVTYTPNAGFSGTDSFTYVATDGADTSNVATVTVTVAPQVNVPPVAVDDTASTAFETAVLIDVLGNDNDPDNFPGPLAVDSVTQGTNGAVLNNGGDVTYTPDAGFSGTDSFTYVATDGADTSNVATVTVTVAPQVNVPPVAVDDTASTAFETAVLIDVLGNDNDPDNFPGPLAVDSVTQGTNGAVLNNGGDVTYTPDAGFSGTDSFTYVATDGADLSNVATVTVTVAPQVNVPPVAVDDTASTAFETAVLIDVLGNDNDPDNFPGPLAVDSVTQGTNGAVLNNGSDVTYTPNAGFSGTDSFTYVATDGADTSNVATVTVTVAPQVNVPPVAVDDTASTAFETAVLIDVLGNDNDPDNFPGPLAVDSVTQGTNGAVLNNGGDVTYTPDAGFSGTDSFTYVATDGADTSNVATVTVTVAPQVNVPPVAVDDTASTAFETAVLIDVLGNDNDPDNFPGPLAVDSVTQGTNGAVLNNGGDVTYTPNAGFSGTDSFTYVATDGADTSNVATVTVTVAPQVNVPPVAVDDTASTAFETAVLIDVLGNDNDPDNFPGPLAVDSVTQGTNGAVLNNGGDVTYTPDAGFSGTDSFTYVATDGADTSNVATVTVTVAPQVNVPPVAVDDTASTAFETAVLIDVLGNDNDPDNFPGPLAVDSVTQGTNGAVLNNGGDVTYTPNAGFSGTDSFTYVATDGADTSNVATVTVTVAPQVNVPPVAVDDTASTAFETAVLIDVLGNDNDPDNFPGPLAVDSVTQGTNGAVLNNGGDVTYTPNAGFSGTDSFTYVATDGADTSNVATVTVTVAPQVNVPPVAVDDTASTAFETAVLIDVLGNDNDPDNFPGPLAVDSVTQGTNGAVLNNGGDVTYTPDAGFSGTDSFTYVATDGADTSNVATVTVTVAPQVNVPPVAVDDTASTAFETAVLIDVLGNDNDPDNFPGPLAVDSVTQGTNGAVLNNGGDVTYTPNAGFSGTDSFTYVATDGADTSNVATVTVTVAPQVNVPPVAVDDTASTAFETAVLIDVLGNDNDPDNFPGPLAVDSVTQGTNGAVLNNGGDVTYTPDAGFSGTDSFTYVATDGADTSNVATVTVTVAPQVNVPPVAVDDTASTAFETAVLIDVLGNDNDPDNFPGPLAVDSVTQGTNGAVLNNGGDVTYTPDAGFSGTDSFTYVATDGADTSNVATVTVTVAPQVNVPPVAVDDTASTAFETAVLIDVLGNDNDPDNFPGPLAVDSVTQGTNGAVLNNGGDVTYTPDAGFSGTDSFTYVATDGADTSNVATVTVTVAPQVNVPPVAVDDTASTAFETAVLIDVLGNDNDPDNFPGPLAVDSVTQGTNGAVLNNGGDVTYTPNAGFSGTDSFTYVATDGADTSNVATVTVTVGPAPADIDVSPLALVFGPVTVGQSGALTTSISNLGGFDLEITGLGLVGSTDFNLGASAPTPPFIIAAGDPPVDVPVVYTPGEEGGDSGTLDITSDDPDEPVVSVALSGSGVAPVLECDIDVNPLALDFGSVEVGNTATASTSVGNTGTADCTVNSLALLGSPDFTLGAGAPSVPFIVAAGGPAVAVPVDYGPSDVGDDSGLLSIGSDDVDEPTVEVSLAGTGVAPAVLDLDIAGFRVTKRVSLSHVKQVGITLTVKNDGVINSATRPATVVGMQNGIEVYSETLAVSDPVGNGRSKFSFPPYTPTVSGDITWTATIADDDLDDDTATATTTVVP